MANETTASFKTIGARDRPAVVGGRFSDDAFGDRGDGAFFEGLLDEIAICNTPLQEADVRYLYLHQIK